MKKNYKIFISISILIILGVIGGLIINQSQIKTSEKQAKEKYLGTFLRYNKNLENANECIQEKVEKEFSKEKNTCEEVYSKRKAAYDDCRKDLYWEDHYGCITFPGANYEEIDCSDENLETKIYNKNYYSCSSKLEKEHDYLINYEKEKVETFIDQFDESKYLITEEEVRELFNTFPEKASNYKLYKRLVTEINNKGYEVEKEEYYFLLVTDELEKQLGTLMHVKTIERDSKNITLIIESEDVESANFILALTEISICDGDKELNDIVNAGGTFYVNIEDTEGELLQSSKLINTKYCESRE